MFSWNLFPHLVSQRPQAAGSIHAVDHFVGWNGLRWGSEPTDDMILDFEDDEGTSCYWRGTDIRKLKKRMLHLCEFEVSSILYSYMHRELCSVGFAVPNNLVFWSIYENLCTAYGLPTSVAEENHTYAWTGEEVAVRMRKRDQEGGTLAWFSLDRLK